MFRSTRPAAAFVRFGATTALSALMTLGLPIVLHEWIGLSENLSVAIAFLVAYLVNFMTLRSVVFQSKRHISHDLGRYAVINGLFRVSEYFLFTAVRQWTPLGYVATLIAILVTTTIIKFFVYRLLFSDARA